MNKVRDYYSRHLSKGDCKIYPCTSATGQYYDEFGHPDFIDHCPKLELKNPGPNGETQLNAAYKPTGGITKDRVKDARLANEEMAKRYKVTDFKYDPTKQECQIRNPTTNEFESYTWHHHQDGKTMMAVRKDIHSASNASHIGGLQAKEVGIEGFFDSPIF